MSGFFSSLFGGANDTLKNNIGSLGAVAGTATTTGQGDVANASNFFNGILKGDTRAIAPEVNSIEKQGQQKKQTISQFGNRSGGNNAGMQKAGDDTLSNVHDLISKLLGTAGSSLASLGSSQEQLGLSAYDQQTKDSQTQMQNWSNSIFGQGLAGAASYAESFLPVPHGGK